MIQRRLRLTAVTVLAALTSHACATPRDACPTDATATTSCPTLCAPRTPTAISLTQFIAFETLDDARDDGGRVPPVFLARLGPDAPGVERTFTDNCVITRGLPPPGVFAGLAHLTRNGAPLLDGPVEPIGAVYRTFINPEPSPPLSDGDRLGVTFDGDPFPGFRASVRYSPALELLPGPQDAGVTERTRTIDGMRDLQLAWKPLECDLRVLVGMFERVAGGAEVHLDCWFPGEAGAGVVPRGLFPDEVAHGGVFYVAAVREQSVRVGAVDIPVLCLRESPAIEVRTFP